MTSGVRNLGHTGWLSTNLQCFAHTIPLRDYLVSGDYISDLNRLNPLGSHDAKLTETVAQILSKICDPRNQTAVDPTKLLREMSKNSDHFCNAPNDHVEAMAYLLKMMGEDTNKIVKKPYIEAPADPPDKTDHELAQEWWDNHCKRLHSTIGDMFYGQLQSQMECLDCRHISRRFEPFQNLQLPVPAKAESATLYDCLYEFARVQALPEVYCPNCKDFAKCSKQQSFYRLPRILGVSLKRFHFSKKGRFKINTHVDFPLYGLNLADWLLPAVLQKDNGNNSNQSPHQPVYDCYAVCNHIEDLSGGVYTANVLLGDNSTSKEGGCWRHCSDKNISVVEPASGSGLTERLRLILQTKR